MTKTATKLVKKAVKTEQKPAENSENLFSVSALSRKFKLDRATVATRLKEAGIEPKSNKSNEKLYLLDDVEIILSRTELDAAKLEKLEVEAEIKKHELAVKRGEYASVAEFTEVVQKIFGSLYKKVVVQLPKKISSRLHNANSTAEVMKILSDELGKEFNGVRSDHKSYL